LSIASALLGAKHILALDLDDVAVESAKSNIELNNVQDQIIVKQNNLLNSITEPADVIVANILAEIIVRFTDDAYRLVKDGGYFITSGIINQKRQEVEDKILSSGFTIVETLKMEDWVTIIAKK